MCRPASPSTCCTLGPTMPRPRSASCDRRRRPRSTTWGASSTCSDPRVRATPPSSPRRRSPRPLADATQLALYRTVQEALTNAHKYGDGHVRLRISHAADGVAVELINPVAAPRVGDLPPRPDAASEAGGFGLMGMRERVLAAGGSLHVGPDGEGRFAVRAHFPNAEEQQ